MGGTGISEGRCCIGGHTKHTYFFGFGGVWIYRAVERETGRTTKKNTHKKKFYTRCCVGGRRGDDNCGCFGDVKGEKWALDGRRRKEEYLCSCC